MVKLEMKGHTDTTGADGIFMLTDSAVAIKGVWVFCEAGEGLKSS